MTEDIKKELVRRCMVNNEAIFLVMGDMVGRGITVSYYDIMKFFDRVLGSQNLKSQYFRSRLYRLPAFYFSTPNPHYVSRDTYLYEYHAPTYNEIRLELLIGARPTMKRELSFTERLQLALYDANNWRI